MDVRKKLVELIDDALKREEGTARVVGKRYVNTIADHLIAHGVTVQVLDGCFRCKDSQKMTVTISNKLIDGVNTGWLGGNLPARYCPFCGRKLPNRRKENDYEKLRKLCKL